MGDRGEAPSWLDAFAPDGKEMGITGIITCLSADEGFLSSALDAFTTQSRGARRADGRIALTMLADRTQGDLPALPGLYQPYCKASQWSPNQQQHSKVALLLFGPAFRGPPRSARLLVSTGNWTTQTGSGSIDLLWTCTLAEREPSTERHEADAGDLLAAADFLAALQQRYDLPPSVADRLHRTLEEARRIAKSHRPSTTQQSRFIATIGSNAEQAAGGDGVWAHGSMGTQILSRFRIGAQRRNAFICGSGFFEQAGSDASQPRILQGLVESLTSAGQMSSEPPTKILVAQAGIAGAVAPWARSGGAHADGWQLAEPRHPITGEAIPFHAKYIFLGNERARITGGQLYFGSGNLSVQGLLRGCLGSDPALHGNVEAGVVLDVPAIDKVDLCRHLGFDPDVDLDPESFEDEEPDETDDVASESFRHPPPIIAATFHPDRRLLDLHRDADEQRHCTLSIDAFTADIAPTANSIVLPADIVVGVRLKVATSEDAWVVPVFTRDGDFRRGEAERYGLDEALLRLLDFPITEEPDDVADEAETDYGITDPAQEAVRAGRRSFPIHRIMCLIEAIAERNQTIPMDQLPDWIAMLKRVLLDEVDPREIETVRALGINVLEPLVAEPGFAPQTPNTAYTDCLTTVIDAWRLTDLPGFVATAKKQAAE